MGTVQPLADGEYYPEKVLNRLDPSPRRRKRPHDEDEEVALFRRVRIKTSIVTMTNSRPPVDYQLEYQDDQGHSLPPVNPTDQNPPCNTLYIGNLPIDTTADELTALFSKQRGYKRLCFRIKQNGRRCFVEFEDVSFATKALHELYGHPLHNSIKSGIRLSFSKNPLGIRSGQSMASSGPPNIPGVM
jgi:hypothetical protein